MIKTGYLTAEKRDEGILNAMQAILDRCKKRCEQSGYHDRAETRNTARAEYFKLYNHLE